MDEQQTDTPQRRSGHSVGRIYQTWWCESSFRCCSNEGSRLLSEFGEERRGWEVEVMMWQVLKLGPWQETVWDARPCDHTHLDAAPTRLYVRVLRAAGTSPTLLRISSRMHSNHIQMVGMSEL